MLFPLISTVFTVYRRSTRPGYTTLRFAALTPLLHMAFTHMAFTTTTRKRLLFVDDEEGIRLTLPPVLEQQGFEVRVAATVPEALVEINSYPFDVLITDLNIGAQGDGFLVISAMRHLSSKIRLPRGADAEVYLQNVLYGTPGWSRLNYRRPGRCL